MDDSCRGDGTFRFVPVQDPTRRKLRSGSRARVNGVRSASKPAYPAPDPVRDPAHDGHFVLYVEGARDREILEYWARRVDRGLARCIERNTVILGGRRPARAVADFQKRGGTAAGYRGLIVLDRDDHAQTASTQRDEGLDIFIWSLRHIESYLLVPAAIRRMLRLAADDRTVERFIETNASDGAVDVSTNPNTANTARGSLDAKRLLGAGGSLSRALGAELRAGDIARAMRIEDLHGDVRRLFDQIGRLSGLAVDGPEVVIRPS